MKRTLTILSAIAGLSLMTSCATVMHGTTQAVNIKSYPQGANVLVDNRPMGQTPMRAKLSRSDSHDICIELDGYKPYRIHVDRSYSKWAFGNICLVGIGAIPGVAIDALTGGIYKLDTKEVCAELHKQTITQMNTGNDVYVRVVEKADPSWERVGSMEALSHAESTNSM